MHGNIFELYPDVKSKISIFEKINKKPYSSSRPHNSGYVNTVLTLTFIEEFPFYGGK